MPPRPPSPEQVADGRVGRETHRPLACDRRSGCWVEVGATACSTFAGNRDHTPRCVACGGRIE
jgi:hypothetical protein